VAEQKDVIFGFYCDNPAFQDVLRQFQRPTQYIGMPAGPGVSAMAPIETREPGPLVQIARQHGVDPLRIAVVGFSIGCSGVTAALRSSDGPRLDAAIAIDGIHTSWTNQRAQQYSTAGLLPWQAFAAAAIDDGRLCCISTSAIVPPSFVGTTVTSDWIWQAATGSSSESFDEPAPGEIAHLVSDPPWVSHAGRAKDGTYSWPEAIYAETPLARYRQKGGLVIYNYRNLDPSGHGDHVYQANVIEPLLLRQYLVPRWNQMDPRTGQCDSGATS